MINTITKIYGGMNNEHSGFRITYQNSNKIKLVPLDEANTDYQAILTWISEGNTVIDNPPE